MPGFDSSKVGVLFLLFLCVYIKYIILMENNFFFENIVLMENE
jgi:hypothetical protein